MKTMRIAIGGYSFHKKLEAGEQDIFKYIEDCKALGCTQLDPWNVQLAPVQSADQVATAGSEPMNVKISAQDDEYLRRVRAASDSAELPFGCIAVDGAHIYEEEKAKRDTNRGVAYRWIEVAEILGAPELRIDAGGPADMPDDVFEIIVEGYNDIISRAGEKGISILVENHWGPTQIPENTVKLLDAVEGLGLLFDSFNWAPGMQEKGWELCHPYAKSTHVKTFVYDEHGNDPNEDIASFVRMLIASGYDGCWGVESCPKDIDEFEAARLTIALIRRCVEASRT
jgi:sugar phosphate isomerase/epimerase